MSALLRRLVRLWGQSRIRLPRRPPGPQDLGPGDRLQAGSRVWRVQGRLLLESGGWMFRLEAVGEAPGEREARLVQSGRTWVLVEGGHRHPLPPDVLLLFPARREVSFDKPEATA